MQPDVEEIERLAKAPLLSNEAGDRGQQTIRTAQAAIAALDPTEDPENLFRASRPGPLHEKNFAPLRASDLLAETPEVTEWIFEEYLPAGSLALLAGKPKEGKTTLVYELAVKVAQGQPFLGRSVRQGGVLILAVEEHRRDVSMRLHTWGPRI
jgi:hypothetical protein